MDCIITAGGIPAADDPLYAYTQGHPKALLPLAGKPLVQWVLNALTAARSIERIILVGLAAGDGISSAKIVAYVPDQGAILANLTAGMEAILARAPDTRQVVTASADIPTITGEMVDWLVTQSPDPEQHINYTIVPQTLMETRFPNARRSYVRMAEGYFAAGDIHVVDPHIAHTHRRLWHDLLHQRKHALRQALRLGPDLLLKVLLRRLSIPEAETRIAGRLGLRGRAVIAQYAELGMDVDKPFQAEICARDLAHAPHA